MDSFNETPNLPKGYDQEATYLRQEQEYLAIKSNFRKLLIEVIHAKELRDIPSLEERITESVISILLATKYDPFLILKELEEAYSNGSKQTYEMTDPSVVEERITFLSALVESTLTEISNKQNETYALYEKAISHIQKKL